MWIRVPCLDLSYASGMTRWQHEKCKKMRCVLKDNGRDVTLAEAREEIELAIQNEANEFRQHYRKRRSRFTERGEARPRENEKSKPKPPAANTSKHDSEHPHALARDPTRPAIAQSSFVLSKGEP
jgi:hypothetical protein